MKMKLARFNSGCFQMDPGVGHRCNVNAILGNSENIDEAETPTHECQLKRQKINDFSASCYINAPVADVVHHICLASACNEEVSLIR